MTRHRPLLLLLLAFPLASMGCRACSSCYDYSSPVAGSAYSHLSGRAGSAISRDVAAIEQPDLQIPAEEYVSKEISDLPTYMSETPVASRSPTLTMPWSTGGMIVQ